MSENLIIFNARIVTPTGTSARKGAEMGQLRIIENGTVEVTKGIITYVGESRGEDRDGYYQHYWHYNARGHCLLPGFVPANEFPETSLGSRRLSEEDECYGSHHGRR